MGTSTVIEFLHPSRLSFGKPEQAGSLTVVPVHHEQEPADYRLFADVAGDEVFVEEVSAGGSVPELRVTNGSAHSILLVEGEVLAGLKQNRTLNVTVLIPAGSQVTVPVTCVEQGRWGRSTGRARSDEVHLSPDIRRAKAGSVQESLRRGSGARSDQGEVWRRVRAHLERHAAPSPTASYSDAHRARRAEVLGLVDRLEPAEGQAGVLAMAGRRPAALDVFDRPDTLRALWEPLVSSYAADAIGGRGAAEERHVKRAVEWAYDLAGGEASRHEAPGLGEMVQVAAVDGVVSALVLGGTVVHLAALPRIGMVPHPRSRVARPSERGSWFRSDG
jgi:hypothetical protein